MRPSARNLTASEAARQLGVSAKALRVYEERSLIAPVRTMAGWRTYGPDQMARAAEIVGLRALGFSLAQIGRVLSGDAQGAEPVLAAHRTRLEAELGQLMAKVERVRSLQGELARGTAPVAGQLARLARSVVQPIIAFDLPWPWGGERFELRDVRRITFITGPLGSGKTRLAQHLAELLPSATWLGMERLADGGETARRSLAADAALRARVEQAMRWLREDGAAPSDALLALLVGLESGHPGPLFVDMIEQGLDETTQEAVIAHLRCQRADGRPLFLLTRSCAILDLESVGADAAIIYCPANHSPPMHVAPHPGAPGYEAVAMCLAPPDVRARTAGVIAMRPQVA